MSEGKDAYKQEFGNRVENVMGAFLPRILHLENLMDHIMSQHFCEEDPERGALFLSLITPDVNFRKKINIFMNMLKIYYNDIYRAYDSDLRKLFEIDDYRNDLMHLMSSPEPVLNQKGAESIESPKSKDRKSIIGKTIEKECESKMRLCIKLATTLKSIQGEIITRGNPSDFSDDIR